MVILCVPRCDALDELGFAIGKGLLYLWLLASPYLTVIGIALLIDSAGDYGGMIGLFLAPLIIGAIGLTILILWMVSSVKEKGIKEAQFFTTNWLIAEAVFAAGAITQGVLVITAIEDSILWLIPGIVGGSLLLIPGIIRLINLIVERKGTKSSKKEIKESVIESTPISETIMKAAESTEETSEKKICNLCGFGNEAEANFCKECGTQF